MTAPFVRQPSRSRRRKSMPNADRHDRAVDRPRHLADRRDRDPLKDGPMKCRAARQQRVRAWRRRALRRPLRQGAPRPLRRISAYAPDSVGDRPVAAGPGDSDFDAGPGPETLTLPGGCGSAGFQLCYEIIFSGEVVDNRANRPDFLFNPSNDAWFGAGARRNISPRRGCARRRKASGDPVDPQRNQRAWSMRAGGCSIDPVASRAG